MYMMLTTQWIKLFSDYSIRSTSQKLPKNSPLYITRTTYLKDLRVGWVGSRISSVPLPPFPLPTGEARIRVQISALHSTQDIDKCLEAFKDIGKKW